MGDFFPIKPNLQPEGGEKPKYKYVYDKETGTLKKVDTTNQVRVTFKDYSPVVETIIEGKSFTFRSRSLEFKDNKSSEKISLQVEDGAAGSKEIEKLPEFGQKSRPPLTIMLDKGIDEINVDFSKFNGNYSRNVAILADCRIITYDIDGDKKPDIIIVESESWKATKPEPPILPKPAPVLPQPIPIKPGPPSMDEIFRPGIPNNNPDLVPLPNSVPKIAVPPRKTFGEHTKDLFNEWGVPLPTVPKVKDPIFKEEIYLVPVPAFPGLPVTPVPKKWVDKIEKLFPF